MPSPSRLAHAVRHHRLPWNARAGLLRVEIAHRMRRRGMYALPLGNWTIYLSRDDYEIDWASLAFVAVDEAYAGDYGGATVVDIGAHKGYYGAYALAQGACGAEELARPLEEAGFARRESAHPAVLRLARR